MPGSERFGERVRSQLAQRLPARACCRRAFLSGLARSAGAFQLRAGGPAVELDLADAAVARRAFALLREVGADCEIHSYREPRFQRRSRVRVRVVGDRGLQLLHEAGVLSERLTPLHRPPPRVTARHCCRGAYLRGAFVAAGSVSAPAAPAHLELRTHDLDAARLLVSLAARDGIELAAGERRGHALAYAKRRSTVRDLLAHIGAHDAALSFEEAETVTATRAAANRLTNFDGANLARLGAAARRQREALERLDLAALAPGLREVADLRLAHPDLSLAELGCRARPQLPKSTVAGRMRTLLTIIS
ncbi:MAG TPA: DNA-binding protein WhiA [Gaiellales bacterium]|nr:DNA-binding protein WhiA [Gaiellales bacterium]